MKIRNYKKTDEKNVFKLWVSTLENKWPIDQRIFVSIINSSKNIKNIILENDKKVLGFVSLEISKKDNKGSIKLLLIDKKYQRKGLGKLLMEFSFEYFKNNGVKNVYLGSGGSSYFWPGIPDNLPNAVSFFKSFDFDYYEKSFDMLGNPKKKFGSSKIRESKEIKIDMAKPKDQKDILKFEKHNLPDWYVYFESFIKRKKFDNILVAKDSLGKIVATVFVFGPYKKEIGSSFKWYKILGKKMGGFGVLGVGKDMREKGIGMAMAKKATEILEKRGVENSYLGWTWLVDWYGKLGYKVWRSYQMAKKKI